MINTKYSEAITDVLDILEHTEEKEVEKIPYQLMEFLKQNKSPNYIPNIDYTKNVKEMKLNEQTQALLGLIYYKYWANEEEKKYFNEKITKNEQRYQDELRDKYSIDNIFKQRREKEEQKPEQALVVIEKESFWKKFINRIKKIFRR